MGERIGPAEGFPCVGRVSWSLDGIESQPGGAANALIEDRDNGTLSHRFWCGPSLCCVCFGLFVWLVVWLVVWLGKPAG